MVGGVKLHTQSYMHSHWCPHGWPELNIGAVFCKLYQKERKKKHYNQTIYSSFLNFCADNREKKKVCCKILLRFSWNILRFCCKYQFLNIVRTIFFTLLSTTRTKHKYALGANYSFLLLSGRCTETTCFGFFCHFFQFSAFYIAHYVQRGSP